MLIYGAAVFTNGFAQGQTGSRDKLDEREKPIFDGLENILESFHYVKGQRFVDDMRRQGAKVFLDSGAFSAWTLKKKLDLTAYCEYIKCNTDILRVEDGALMASVLDSIGNAQGTYCNQLEMEARGVRPLPCFHKGEDERYLEYYLANYDYITIGGMVGSGYEQLTKWLDRIWERYLVDGTGHAKVKVHGFGMTSIPLMKNYPWHSVDSSSWIQYAVYGHIFDPKHGVVTVSEKSPKRHDAGYHITTLTAIEREYMNARLRANGFDPERLASIYEARASYNLWSFREINREVNSGHELVFRAQVRELF